MGRHHTKLLLMTFNPVNPQWIIHFNHNQTLGLCLFVLDIKLNTELCPKISIRLIISYASHKIFLFILIMPRLLSLSHNGFFSTTNGKI